MISIELRYETPEDEAEPTKEVYWGPSEARDDAHAAALAQAWADEEGAAIGLYIYDGGDVFHAETFRPRL